MSGKSIDEAIKEVVSEVERHKINKDNEGRQMPIHVDKKDTPPSHDSVKEIADNIERNNQGNRKQGYLPKNFRMKVAYINTYVTT